MSIFKRSAKKWPPPGDSVGDWCKNYATSGTIPLVISLITALLALAALIVYIVK